MTDSPMLRPCAALLVGLAACTPALNWRDVKPTEAQGLTALFPCKPDQAERRLTVPGLDGGPATLHVLSCQAEGITWALSYMDTGTPARLAQALPALDQALWANLSTSDASQARRQDLGPTQVRGADTHPGARAWMFDGTRPVSTSHSEPVRVKAWTFAHGLTAFQATVWKSSAQGSLQVDDPAVEAFVQGFNFPR